MRRAARHFGTMSQPEAIKLEPPMRVGIIPVTPLEQNCSLIWCTKTMRGALIDPGGDLDKVKAAVANTLRPSRKTSASITAR